MELIGKSISHFRFTQIIEHALILPCCPGKTIERMEKASSEMGIKKGIVLTLDESEVIELPEQRVITVMPVYQWLLV